MDNFILGMLIAAMCLWIFIAEARLRSNFRRISELESKMRSMNNFLVACLGVRPAEFMAWLKERRSQGVEIQFSPEELRQYEAVCTAVNQYLRTQESINKYNVRQTQVNSPGSSQIIK